MQKARSQPFFLRGVMLWMFILACLAFLSFGIVKSLQWIIPDQGDFNEMSYKAEEMLATALNGPLLAESIKNPKLEEQLEPIYFRLTNGLTNLPFPAQFHIVAKAEPNAFALPGGHIAIHTGLIRTVDSAESLAGVLAHELGHVYHRDSMKIISAQMGIAVVIAAISGGDPGLVHDIMNTLARNTYSRSMETQADEYAFDLLIERQINPQGIIDFFEELNTLKGNGTKIPEWISTHPDTEKRVDYLRSRMKTLSGQSFKPFNMSWTRVQESL